MTASPGTRVAHHHAPPPDGPHHRGTVAVALPWVEPSHGEAKGIGERCLAVLCYGPATSCVAASSVHLRFHSAMACSPLFFCCSLQCCSMTARAEVVACTGSYSAARWLHT